MRLRAVRVVIEILRQTSTDLLSSHPQLGLKWLGGTSVSRDDFREGRRPAYKRKGAFVMYLVTVLRKDGSG